LERAGEVHFPDDVKLHVKDKKDRYFNAKKIKKPYLWPAVEPG
jgi:hypothetical protein